MLHPQGFTRLPFSTPCVFNTLRLAHVLDSLVRVSRRVVRNRFVYNQVIGEQLSGHPTPRRTLQQAEQPLLNKDGMSSSYPYLLQAISDLHTYNKTEARSSRG